MTADSFVARSPEDLIALVPYLLGFHPEESVVLLTFGAPAGSFHARVDLPATDPERRATTAVLCAAVRANAVPTTAVLVFSDDAAASRAACARLVPGLLEAGAAVVDAIRADGRCWWPVLDPAPEPHPYDVSCHRFTAERVLEGQVAFRNRAELAASLDGSDPDDVAAVSAAADPLVDELLTRDPSRGERSARADAAWLRDRLSSAVACADPLPVADAARILVLAQLVAMRDVACARLHRDSAPAQVRLWRDLLRRAPVDLVPGAAALLALAAWLDGNGALAWCAVDRCLAVAPDHSLARLVGDLLQGAVPPATWSPPDEGSLPLLRGLEAAS